MFGYLHYVQQKLSLSGWNKSFYLLGSFSIDIVHVWKPNLFPHWIRIDLIEAVEEKLLLLAFTAKNQFWVDVKLVKNASCCIVLPVLCKLHVQFTTSLKYITLRLLLSVGFTFNRTSKMKLYLQSYNQPFHSFISWRLIIASAVWQWLIPFLRSMRLIRNKLVGWK